MFGLYKWFCPTCGKRNYDNFYFGCRVGCGSCDNKWEWSEVVSDEELARIFSEQHESQPDNPLFIFA
jgi:hypothetical protein